MRKLGVFITAIMLTQAITSTSAWAHFSTQRITASPIRVSPVTHTHDSLSQPSKAAPAPFISRPNIQPFTKADELRYRNADFKSRCLHLENADPKAGTQNIDIPNMRLKFENPQLRRFNFNAE
jgi:hypothetical protein